MEGKSVKKQNKNLLKIQYFNVIYGRSQIGDEIRSIWGNKKEEYYFSVRELKLKAKAWELRFQIRKMIKVTNNLIVRSSSAEFLIFERQKGEKGIEVRFEDGDLWLTQKAISDLFDTSKQDVSYHLKNIFNTLELEEKAVVKKYLTTASDNKKYNTNYYNLDAVISIGFRINSDKAIQFRRWSINILKEFSKKDYNKILINNLEKLLKKSIILAGKLYNRKSAGILL